MYFLSGSSRSRGRNIASETFHIGTAAKFTIIDLSVLLEILRNVEINDLENITDINVLNNNIATFGKGRINGINSRLVNDRVINNTFKKLFAITKYYNDNQIGSENRKIIIVWHLFAFARMLIRQLLTSYTAEFNSMLKDKFKLFF
uniref:Uncharacterized protein n=1 Tax=Meloidogyne hapla TaxID=6305 RepID=A0A1I8BML6_MELHA